MQKKRSVAPQTVHANRRISARLAAQGTGTTSTTGQSRSASGHNESIHSLPVRLAETPWDHIQAFHLLHEQYASFGYIDKHVDPVKISPWNLQDRSFTLIAEDRKRVVGTMSGIMDGLDTSSQPKLLPADRMYSRELDVLRKGGRILLEMSSFATIQEETPSDLVVKLVRTAFTVSSLLWGSTDWICTVNPRHAGFYTRVLLFEHMGEEQACTYVGDAPSVLLRRNLETLPEQFEKRYAHRTGKRNLHDYFFNPTRQRQRMASLQNAFQRRAKQWDRISSVLESLGGTTETKGGAFVRSVSRQH